MRCCQSAHPLRMYSPCHAARGPCLVLFLLQSPVAGRGLSRWMNDGCPEVFKMLWEHRRGPEGFAEEVSATWGRWGGSRGRGWERNWREVPEATVSLAFGDWKHSRVAGAESKEGGALSSDDWLSLLLLLLFLYLYWSIIALRWCVSFCVQQSESAICIHISPYPLPLEPPSHPPYPTPLGGHKAPSRSPCAMQLLPTSHPFYIWWCIYVHATLSLRPSLPFPPCVLKSLLYICVFIPVLPLGSSVPFF